MRKSQTIKGCGVLALTVVLTVFCIAGCSPQQNDKTPAQDGAKTEDVQVDWSLSTDCVTCHVAEKATMVEGASGAHAHVQQAQATCATCHVDEAKLAKAHEGKTATDPMPKKLKTTTVDTETCQSSGCHDLTEDEMLALTAGNTGLIDSKGTQVSPHNVIGLTSGHADITCSSCHNMHDEKMDAAALCVTCHHAGVYECNTCH